MIPNTLHFIFGLTPNFGDRPFGLIHYYAIYSAVKRIKPSNAYLYYTYAPENNMCWEDVQKYVTLVKIDAPTRIYGNQLTHYAHKSDVLRLQILKEQGGIYLDCDTFTVRSLDKLLDCPCVLGRQGIRGLCNAVIMAEPNSEFINRWLGSYKSFDEKDWDYQSVVFPLHLAEENPTLLHIEPASSFFYPMHTELDLIYEKDVSSQLYTSSYILHLWEHAAWDNYIRSGDFIFEKNTYTTLLSDLLNMYWNDGK